MTRRLLIQFIYLMSLGLSGCTYIASATTPGLATESDPAGPTELGSAPIVRPAAKLPAEHLRLLSLNETATVPGRTGGALAGPSLFDVTVTDYQLMDRYYNPIGGIERPPQGTKILFVRVSAANVTPWRGRLPLMVASRDGTGLRGCPIAHGDRASYDVMREVFPAETAEGWLCHIVPADAQAHEIHVSAGRRSPVSWRLIHFNAGFR